MKLGFGLGHILLGADPAPSPWGRATQFWAHICCGQTSGWIKIPLGTKVGLGPGHVVLHGDPASPKWAQPPIFGPCLLWPNVGPSQLDTAEPL